MEEEKWLWHTPPSISLKSEILIRDCYEELYSDIRDLTGPERGMRYIHISGNPGIGKSCFLWYVLHRLLKEEDTAAVIVELVRKVNVDTHVFQRDGRHERVSSVNASPHYTEAGVWLLTDQRFVGSNPEKGRTVLFASPKKDNWEEARKTMNQALFRTLYMPPWSVEELQAVCMGDGRTYTEFWKMYYVAGPVVRHYFNPLQEAYDMICSALMSVLDHGAVDATLFRGGHDKGQYSHQVFMSWPTLDFSRVDHISFISEFAADGFAVACFNGKMRDWMNDTLSLTTDRALRGAAGVLFERYAHQRLSLGGEFSCIDDPKKSLRLEKRDVKFLGGNNLQVQVPGLFYLQPSSASFPVIDAIYPPLIVFQISLAIKRKAIRRSDYEALRASLMKFREEHRDVPTGLVGVETDEVYSLLVKMEGDNTNNSTRMFLRDDVAAQQDVSQPLRRSKRFRRGTEVSISSIKDQKPTPVVRRRSLPFQMTIALNVDVTFSLPIPSFQEIHDVVCSRMVDEVDTGAKKFGDSKREDVDAAVASVIMRQGKGSMQYEEQRHGVPAFVVWIEAVRSEEAGKFKVKTTLDVLCSTGKLAGRELTIFINERLGPDVMCYPPSVLAMSRPGERVSQQFDEPALRGKALRENAKQAHSGEHEFEWSGDRASVVIKSNAISSRKITLLFPADESQESEDGDEGSDDEDYYMQD